MIALDVNVLLYAMRSDLPQHQTVYDWLESVRADRQPVALFPPVLVGLTRIATSPRIFVNPSSLGTVINFARALRTTPGFAGATDHRAGAGDDTGPVRAGGCEG